jgi:hypothetical protein
MVGVLFDFRHSASRGCFGEVLSALSQDFFFDLYLFALRLNTKAKPSVDAHVDVGQPDQRENGNQNASPIVEKQTISGEKHKDERDPMAQAVFASEPVIELSLEKPLTFLAALLAVFA